MDDLRSKSYSYRDDRLQVISYGHHGGEVMGPNGLHDLRCYSASYATSATQPPPYMNNYNTQMPKELKKGKSSNGSISKAWCFSDPELQRKKRVASYKVYAVEGKMKGSFRKSFRWLKDRSADDESRLVVIIAAMAC
ncbi:hypothetical protein Droror1_Dr00007183 [Drosera rotundifolia]